MSDSYYTTITMTKEEYETVAGYSLGPAPRNGQGSGGYYQGNIRIEYDPKVEEGGGISGKGWYTTDSRSPFSGCDPAKIVEDYRAAGNNLNSYFYNWSTAVPSEKRTEFIQSLEDDCWGMV